MGINWIATGLLAVSAMGVSGCKRQAQEVKEPSPVQPVTTAAVVRLEPSLDGVLAAGTKIEKVADGFQFTEGPMWREGRLWFADLVGNRVYAVSPQGKTELLIDHSGGLDNPPAGSYLGSNGMVTDKDGSVLMVQHGARRVVRIDAQKKMTTVIDRFEGKRLNSPNDLVFAPDGALWITDPPFGLAKQDNDPAKEVAFNGVYRYKDGKLTAPIQDLPKPNGIGFSPDGKTLYVSNSGPKMLVMKYPVNPDGTVGKGSVLIEYPEPAQGVPDGLKIDAAGNVWATGPGGIRIISPDGDVLGQIRLPETAANLAWAEGGNTLYITASTSIYRLDPLTKGMMPMYSK